MISRGWSDDGTIEEMDRDCYQIAGLALRTVLDIGANIGSFTRQVCDLNPNVHVECYEPEADNFALLERNTEGLPVTLHQVAVWSHDEGLTIAGQRGLSHVCPGIGCRATRDHHAPQPVPSRTLESILAEPFDLLKMDVEGAEFDILENCPLDALRKVRYLRMELHDYFDDTRRHALYERLGEVFAINIVDFVRGAGGIWVGERV